MRGVVHVGQGKSKNKEGSKKCKIWTYYYFNLVQLQAAVSSN